MLRQQNLDKYLADSEKNRASAYCGNPIINMLVSHYHDAAKERDIRFSVHIDVPNFCVKLPCKAYSLAREFSLKSARSLRKYYQLF